MTNKRNNKIETGIHAATGKAWARVRSKLGAVEQWANTEAEALAKCNAYIARHKV
jgi:hypothetical protein